MSSPAEPKYMEKNNHLGSLFQPNRSERGFLNPYRTYEGDMEYHLRAVNFSSQMGTICENISTRVITSPPEIHYTTKENMQSVLDRVREPLAQRVKMTKPEKGKALTHQQVLPYYLDTIKQEKDCLLQMSQSVDLPNKTNFVELITDISHGVEQKQESAISIARYAIDALLISYDLTINGLGVGTDIKKFGRLIPNVYIFGQNGLAATQFDGLFVPSIMPAFVLPTAHDRLRFLKQISKKRTLYGDSELMLTTNLLEIKTLFRPRQLTGPVPKKIPIYQKKEILGKMSAAFIYGGFGVIPAQILCVHLRSLGPNTLHLWRPANTDIEDWITNVWGKIQDISSQAFIDRHTRKEIESLTALVPYLDVLAGNATSITTPKTEVIEASQEVFKIMEKPQDASSKPLFDIDPEKMTKRKRKNKAKAEYEITF